jgi:hypothetical protein
MKKSRIIYPESYKEQRELLKKINTKHVADAATPAGSVLTAMLTQKGIVLSNDLTAGTNADAWEVQRADKSKEKESFRQLRDRDFKKINPNFTGSVQFLKSFYKPDVHALGTWKITVDGVARIKYPTTIIGKVDNYKEFIDYHATLTAPTPLTPYLAQHTISLSTDATTIGTIKLNAGKFAQASNDTEQYKQNRDNEWTPVDGHIHMIGDFLMKLYSNNTKKLGEWGFTVDDSPQKPKYRTSILKLGQQVQIDGVVIGGTLINLLDTPVHVYKGTAISGTPIIVNGGERLGMLKGFSKILVVNPSTLEDAKFKVLVNR